MADQVDNKPIQVIIAGRSYPLRVSEAEEDGLRALVEEINARFSDFQLRYRDRDKQDCLVMTLLTYASELRGSRSASQEGVDEQAISERLRRLDELVEGML
jgi:cell division protein ZapA